MSKITTEHLARGAYVYIRQSTADQLMHNHESRRRQYALANRARQLGWSTFAANGKDNCSNRATMSCSGSRARKI